MLPTIQTSSRRTRNPMKMTADGDHLTLRVAPDNGDEGNGTEILTYEATVAPQH